MGASGDPGCSGSSGRPRPRRRGNRGRTVNDDFANAETITGATGTVAGSTVDATNEDGFFIARDVWYQWTAPADGEQLFVLHVPHTPFFGAFNVGTGATRSDVYASSGPHVDCTLYGLTSSEAANRICVRLPVLSGVTYKLRVHALAPEGSADPPGTEFTIHWRSIDAAPPVPNIHPLPTLTGQCAVVLTPPTATDAHDGPITATTTDPLTYSNDGTFLVTWTYTDDAGNDATQTQAVIVDDTIAPVPNVAPLPTVNGVGTATIAAPPTATDNCAGSITGTTPDPLTYSTLGTHTVTWTYADGRGNSSTQSQSVVVTAANVPPVLGPLTGPTVPKRIGEVVTVTGRFTDGNVGDTHTASIDWGDGSSSAAAVTESGGSGTATGTHTYAVPGVYTVTMIVRDGAGASDEEEFRYVVVFDPSAGFVTGGGWIVSPAGAYEPNPSLTGKATFGFVAKYQKGASVPKGETQFQFHAAGLSFQSTAYEWLVVAGSKAKFKGSGTLNGAAGYDFQLTANDGSPDSFRIKIWNRASGGVVYDNKRGAANDGDDATALSGGSIVVHKG